MVLATRKLLVARGLRLLALGGYPLTFLHSGFTLAQRPAWLPL